MRNWRELGEVPDSEDEDDEFLDDLDFQASHEQADDEIPEVLPDAPLPTKAPSPSPARQNDTPKPTPEFDIWALPSSPAEERRLHNPVKSSTSKRANLRKEPPGPVRSPALTQTNAVPDRPPSSASSSCSSIPDHEDDDATPRPTNKPAPDAAPFQDDEISTGYVRITTPEPQFPAMLVASSPLSSVMGSPELSKFGPSETPVLEAQSQTHQLEAPVHEEEELSRETSVRPGRSFRPRKPIQQHPYLLESVHYSQFMKSHGIKPVKVILPSRSEDRRASEEDSQDQEFQTEESQEKSGDSGRREDDDLVVDNGIDNQDELSISPSPPKTSPFVRHLDPSSQPNNADHTDVTSVSSVSGDDEFPSLGRLEVWRKRQRSRNLKRQPSQTLPGNLKRQKLASQTSNSGSPRRALIIPPLDPFGMSSSPEPSPPCHHFSEDLGNTPRPLVPKRTFVPRSALRASDPSRRAVPSQTIDLTVLDQGDEAENLSEPGSNSASDAEHSDSGAEVILRNRRRIRGVLPASWLRLDQQKDAPTSARNHRHSPEPTSRIMPQRGVALPKQTTVGSSTANPFVFDESGESDSGSTPVPQSQRPSDNGLLVDSSTVTLNEDDGASVIEEDHIDWMLPGRKRSASSDLLRGSKRPKTTPKSTFGKPPGQFSRQPKITQVLNRSKQTTAGTHKRSSAVKSAPKTSKGGSTRHVPRKRASPPPRLSILDVAEPKAPNFIRIAARTARKKPGLGKSSPSKKMISLATRNDNVDALSTLRDWKTGKTRPKVTAPSTISSHRQASRSVLQEIDPNAIPPPIPPNLTSMSSRQSMLDKSVSTTSGDGRQASPKPKFPMVRRRNMQPNPGPSFRPAQLEICEDDVQDQGTRFAAKKRSLDALFRQSQRAADASSIHASTLSFQDMFVVQDTHRSQNGGAASSLETSPGVGTKTKESRKSRFKKRQHPQYIDLEAPQYDRLNDPLPPVVRSIQEEVRAQERQDKLFGLEPYGTHYTHHFEVFPLEGGTYFHESTIIGRGYIRKATQDGLGSKIRHPRATISFVFDAQALRWGPWNDTTSSELGVLFDWISDQVALGTVQEQDNKLLKAANFVLDYILDSMSVQSDLEQAAVVLRLVEVLTSFITRSESLGWAAVPERAHKALLDVFARFLIALLSVVTLSRNSAGGLAQQIKIEALITRFSSFAIKGLLGLGLEDLRTLYGELQSLSARERGIRPRHVLANCWVVVIRVLEAANIPRSSFWDVAQAVMLEGGVTSGLDARVFERLWQDMFTLLPLGEINDDGILITGLRNTAPLEGWRLPQQLTKRVLEVYKANPRQSPGFNDYCRSLIARCHLLVQVWGWRKCTGIIGTVFDFFGSQSLAHLRNEEVYQSPVFIEALHLKPSLSIEPEDRCFHIFIKMLGLVIQRLRQLGRENEVKNLVTRTLPNHNRQYLKEDAVHQHELAALRNHHDLLCTLFWAAPPDRRPPVRLIEKLITPSKAHKEACIINIKAWNRLARFVIVNGEGGDAFKPFASWRNNVFHQVMDQYLSAASDIQQQFKQLSEQGRGISTEMRDSMIARNKASAMDVLHCSLKASLDVLKHAPTLEATTYSFNITQLQKILTGLDYRSAGFDWSVLRVALDTLEVYVTRLDEASEAQYSSEFAADFDPRQLEDATLLLHDQLAKDFFWMARTTLSLPRSTHLGKRREQASCANQTVTLAARIAIRFITPGLAQLRAFFSTGKFGIFPDIPKNLHGPLTQYLPLFTTTLVKNQVFDFKSIESSILELWVLSIVKPARFLEYENQLAEVLQRQNVWFLEGATVLVGMDPDYNSSVDYLSCVLHHMRRRLREGGSTRSRQQRDEFAKVLHLAMQKVKHHLRLLRAGEQAEHAAYIKFVRQVMALMKSHGVGICVIDPFFSQPSLDYSPPLQDPGMHVANIVAYGVRLGEKDHTAVPQLFHYMYNNFKVALSSNQLDRECDILVKAMDKERHIVSFVLQFMVPAVIRASVQSSDVWILLETYVAALAHLLTRSTVPREVKREDIEHAVGGVLGSVLFWLAEARDKIGRGNLDVPQLYLLTLLVTLANSLRPSIRVYLASDVRDADVADREQVRATMESLSAVFSGARELIGEVLPGGRAAPLALEADVSDPKFADRIYVHELLSGLPPPPASSAVSSSSSGQQNSRMQGFVQYMVSDVRKSWVVVDGLVTVRTASTGAAGGSRLSRVHSMSMSSTPAQSGGPGGSQAGGTKCQLASADELVRRLYAEMGKWVTSEGNHGRVGDEGRASRNRRAGLSDDLFLDTCPTYNEKGRGGEGI
ncbi:protein mms22 [Rhypophila decipiens]|uniref:Protein mms22 n=1 Tax=Rhypophila decipiens TaxID=261697 RepID=A0AAN6Y7D0_9PEZI|nr:protein mms22 [Rhypophila decipiens]